MKFGYCILYVKDVEKTLAFYEKAFKLTRRMLSEKKEYGELETGGTRLAFADASFAASLTPVPHAKIGPEQPAAPVELGLVTDDVDGAYAAALTAGAVNVKKPEKKPWGQIVSYVRDLNGFLVEICSPIN
jgi:uncharacterized glyoxalase superfamily protein PhnB